MSSMVGTPDPASAKAGFSCIVLGWAVRSIVKQDALT